MSDKDTKAGEKFEKEFLKSRDWDEEKKRWKKYEESIGIDEEYRKKMRESLIYKAYLLEDSEDEDEE